MLSKLMVGVLLWAVAGIAQAEDWISCEGDYEFHLQGVARDDSGDLYWSFTTELVKTDASGSVITKVDVPNHHGDLCFEDGKIYVAVNLGEFNQPPGKADSWVYVYAADSLELLSKHPVPEVVHGAGGIDIRDGNFYVVGGLPLNLVENYVYQYTDAFEFVRRRVIASGWTLMGIQTAAWHDDAWWFGCYGEVKTLLKTDKSFRLIGHFPFDGSLGIVGVSEDRLLVADGPKTPEGRCRGRVRLMKPDRMKGLVKVIPES